MIQINTSLCNSFYARISIPQDFEEKIVKKTNKRANSEFLVVFIGGSLDRSKLSSRTGRACRELITEFNEYCGTFNSLYRAALWHEQQCGKEIEHENITYDQVDVAKLSQKNS